MGGLWSEPGVPHKGWTCIEVIDRRPDPQEELDSGTCEWCLNACLRFVHILEHPEYETTEAGCVCAEKLCTNYDGAAHERQLRNKAARKRRRTEKCHEVRGSEVTEHLQAKTCGDRRDQWLNQSWKISKAGNLYLNVGAKNIGVFPDRWYPGKWRWWIDREFGKQRFNTVQEAQLALFDALYVNARQSISTKPITAWELPLGYTVNYDDAS